MAIKYQDKQAVTFTIPAGSTWVQRTITHNLKKMSSNDTTEQFTYVSFANVEIVSSSGLANIPYFLVWYTTPYNGTITVFACIPTVQGNDVVINTIVNCVMQHSLDN